MRRRTGAPTSTLAMARAEVYDLFEEPVAVEQTPDPEPTTCPIRGCHQPVSNVEAHLVYVHPRHQRAADVRRRAIEESA